ncbi:hypothetical protein CEXT_425181 [Caerostris extrusa]|uniref:Uncharacterized protein n=1 Tax=Caerostris extrusa TaxID=172846 RepID=A0AAV4QY41_CAEEX|nr:hypothetical protein CEXT_425181 [Caerostris extrusa]
MHICTTPSHSPKNPSLPPFAGTPCIKVFAFRIIIHQGKQPGASLKLQGDDNNNNSNNNSNSSSNNVQIAVARVRGLLSSSKRV